MSAAEFQDVQRAYESGGTDSALNQLADHLRAQKKYHELFEALKMQVRHQMKLPLFYGDSSDHLTDEQRNQLEEGLIAACRDVGMMLLKDGRIREGWMYLRPVGDKNAAREVLDKVEPGEDNLEELIDVCLREGVDVPRGFRLVLENYGCCNSITTFEGEVTRHGRDDQQAAAAILIRSLHRDLLENVRADIGRQEGSSPTEMTLRELIQDRPWMFGEMSYHIDTTHLASVVKFARLVSDRDVLRIALDLTEYGRKLHKQFQYPGDEPFAEMYVSHALYFQALLGENVDAALEYFRQKAESTDNSQQGPMPAEVYVDLLARVGRSQEALEAAIRILPANSQQLGIAPSLMELARQAQAFERVQEFCREKDDLLGFTAALVKASRE